MRRNTAVAAVLGGDLHDQLRWGEVAAGGSKGDVDIEILLKGAEKLCGVYALPGALERIPALRAKHAHHKNTMIYYEAKVAEQAQALELLNKDHWMDHGDKGNDDEDSGSFTEDDLRIEEEEVRELDKKKKELQERLRAMDKDLGGLLNI
jgi:DASH complex subunit Spc34